MPALLEKDKMEQPVISPKMKWSLKAQKTKYRKLSFQQSLFQEEYTDSDFTFIDLFAGIGGIRMGFESINGKCVFTSEWNKYSEQTYRNNFAVEHNFAGDITEVDENDIPDHDVLLAGFPCQPFSIAGVSKKNALGRPHGFADLTQGTLFFDIKRIIKEKQPAAFLLENVKNLKSHDKGKTFNVIMQTLENELGYTVKSKIIDARNFVPQHRERIYIVGFKDDVGFSFDGIEEFFSDPPALKTILHSENGSEKSYKKYKYLDGEKDRVQDKYTLTDNLWQYLQAYKEKHRKQGNGFGFGMVSAEDVARTLSARYYKDGSEILVNQGESRNPRRLTPRECARLMGYPDDFRIPVSDTQAYRQFGNSVVVPVIIAIAKIMEPYIIKAVNSE